MQKLKESIEIIFSSSVFKIGMRELCWNNFGNNDGVKESRIIRNFDAISGHNWHKNDFPDLDTLIEQSFTLIEQSARSSS